MKEEEQVKCEEDQVENNFVQNMFMDFNEFGNNSPFFIPWSEKERNHSFDLQEDKSLLGDKIGAAIKFCDSEESEM